MKKGIQYFLIVAVLMFSSVVRAEEVKEGEGAFNPKEAIFSHLGDEYGWKIELPDDASVEIPLPVIVRDALGGWHVFSSARLQGGNKYDGFYIAAEGDNEGKVEGVDEQGYVYRPVDLSITKNVLAILISSFVLLLAVFLLVHWYKRNPLKAPRRGLGVMEMVIDMVYMEVIVPILGHEARRFAPYLLTLFFFILFSNLLGMMVVFPGGANVMGNVSVTLILALCTFVVVNVSGTKKYWLETFWPEVPTWLKFPIPMMPIIEVFGIFTKPVALMIRLFANMLAGHLITLVLISLIFLFGTMGATVMGTTTLLSVLFAVFMNLIDFLICFIQAYVFMMLSTIFISLARVGKTESRRGVE